jgi:6-pyruvoyl-tetrahydropterin synthase
MPDSPGLANVNSDAIENEIDVFPAKHFFVDSLTRDIDLADAILDLLDNCVDGVRRIGLAPGGQYDGYWARVSFDTNSFSIVDNCGGISLKDAKQSALRFGRPSDYIAKADGTIGVIGIGMKRAILKMGKCSTIHSHHKDDTFEVKITPEWLDKDDDWKLHFQSVTSALAEFGTRIQVTELNDSVQEQFGTARFKKALHEKVSGAFAILISRGFKVTINDKDIEGHIPTLLWQDNTSPGAEVIRPYIYRDIIDGVEVYIAVGFRVEDKIPDEDEETTRYYRTESAGWTVACNDRVVLYCDKSEQTGWGTGGVPVYHTQFIPISGFAEFVSKNTDKLPFTTTKHGVNQQSEVFLKVLDVMRRGTKMFTEWTNRIKPYATQKSAIFAAANARSVSVEEIKTFIAAPKIPAAGEQRAAPIQIEPVLPKPKTQRKECSINFRRPVAEVRAVSEYLFGDPEAKSRHEWASAVLSKY